MNRIRFIIALTVFVSFLSATCVNAQNENAKRIEKIQEYVTHAGSLFKNGLFEDSGKKIKDAQRLLQAALESGEESDREVLDVEYRRIAKAHELLSAKGIELPELMEFPETIGGGGPSGADEPEETEKDPNGDEPAETEDGSDMDDSEPDNSGEQTISFKNQIAPLFVTHCGNCHVRGSKGKFNMGTFEKLLAGVDGTAMVPGSPDESRIVEVIEAGEMPPTPRGKDPVEFPAEDLELIKTWITQGGKFDGEDESAPIAGKQNAPPRGDR